MREHGQPIAAVASRSPARAAEACEFIGGSARQRRFEELDCDCILIAVPDRAISFVADLLPAPRMVLHTCGAYGAELLGTLQARGVSCGSLHPLQTFSTAEEGYRALPGCAFAIDGDEAARGWAVEIAGMVEGQILRIPGAARAIYHAAAVMASNHVTSLIDAAVQLLNQAGVPERDGLNALAPLTKTAMHNTFEQGPVRALTGPVERGDIETVHRHLEALADSPATILELYRAASMHAVQIARRRNAQLEAHD
jgi:predicted short-subunit dehydrogenase-like oxidoreductase (DUF2520 family)